LNGLFFAFFVDFMMENVIKVDDDKTGWRKKRMPQSSESLLR
jgi:hypothetical protein